MHEAENGPADFASLIISGKIPILRLPPPSSPASPRPPVESIESYILAYYYAALTNLFCQAHLSPVERVEEHDTVRVIADSSYRDFCMLDGWLGTLDLNELQLSLNWSLYVETREGWRNLVKNWAMITSAGHDKHVARRVATQRQAG